MIRVIQNLFEKNQRKKNLLAFLNEMERNLELFYVIDQRQFVTQGFSMDSWNLVKDSDMVKKHESIKIYGRSLESFNKHFKEFKEYEQWYASDMTNKTPENAKKLHAMKHDMDQKIKGLEPIIILAGQELEKEMLRLGLLSK
jgi:hypothetical protein